MSCDNDAHNTGNWMNCAKTVKYNEALLICLFLRTLFNKLVYRKIQVRDEDWPGQDDLILFWIKPRVWGSLTEALSSSVDKKCHNSCNFTWSAPTACSYSELISEGCTDFWAIWKQLQYQSREELCLLLTKELEVGVVSMSPHSNALIYNSWDQKVRRPGNISKTQKRWILFYSWIKSLKEALSNLGNNSVSSACYD